MTCVDTSIWIEAHRRPELLLELRSLMRRREVMLPVVVQIELLAGSRNRRAQAARGLAALQPLEPGSQTWRRVEGWVVTGADAGQNFGIPDLLIAALAAERSAPVWTLDRDFARMADLGWITLYQLTGRKPN